MKIKIDTYDILWEEDCVDDLNESSDPGDVKRRQSSMAFYEREVCPADITQANSLNGQGAIDPTTCDPPI